MISELIVKTIILTCYGIALKLILDNIVIYYGVYFSSKKQDIESDYQNLITKKRSVSKEKLDVENEAIKIFTLYEITREITKSLSEEDAFKTFKEKLSEHVSFDECVLINPDPNEIKKYRSNREYYIFNLQGKKKRIGYLAFKGVSALDMEKVAILANQFALALRRVKLYEEIERIAITDSLTEMYTRRYVLDRLEEEVKRSKTRKIKMSYLMIDVDHFKKINDEYGHLAGDMVLREIGVIIQESIREIDIAGRFGGEEFCVVLPDTDQEGAMYAAERIRKAAEEKLIKAYDANVRVTLSIGNVTFPSDGSKVEELIDKADWALYRAKKLGRNRVCSFGVYNDKL